MSKQASEQVAMSLRSSLANHIYRFVHLRPPASAIPPSLAISLQDHHTHTLSLCPFSQCLVAKPGRP